jgi:hypothetical protein
MFGSKSNLRISRKGVVRTTPAQDKNTMALKELDETIDKSTIEQISIEKKSQLCKELDVLSLEILISSDQAQIEIKISLLAAEVNKMRQAKMDEANNLTASPHLFSLQKYNNVKKTASPRSHKSRIAK